MSLSLVLLQKYIEAPFFQTDLAAARLFWIESMFQSHMYCNGSGLKNM